MVFGSSGGKNAKIAVFIVVFGVHRGALCRRENKTGISTSSATVMERPQKNLLSDKGCSKNEVELIFDFLEMNFCQLRKEHSGLCDRRNLQKGRAKKPTKT